ncbi:2-oxoglutarate-Fe(II) type oxidoreductase hxnY isoform X1 [Dendrobium catenatum]|nr:2-oxoglutarate-Fe(II) type oxidoreductase hxnY isoform X1 [Dendrobium catenatum]XP_020676040.1 2-oxoglutarate-Fe(II) type oxidoreductase hxnY isoform X1 [Dendrobium catenatum]
MAGSLQLPLVDLFSADRAAAVQSIREACLEYGFFYIKNHGIDREIQLVFRESEKFFSLPFDEKMKLQRNDDHRGYTPPYAENLDPSSKSKGDLKESFYIGPAKSCKSILESNQWPSEASLPLWRATMVSYHEKVLIIGKHLLSLIALSLKLDERFFETIGALDPPMGFVRLLHYPGELKVEDYDNYGASAHSDYGMITLLVTDGVPGLQICRDKDRRPQLWEDVPHIEGAFIVNIGDMLERWTNCLFRSTLHRVVAIGKERYSVAFFLDPSTDCLVECLESCCSETSPPRFPPIRGGDYLKERLELTYSK